MDHAIVLRSEFGYVRVERDTAGGGDRLKITDLRTGKSSSLDPLELECLAWSRHEDLRDLLDPSLTRWRPE
ncbi:hypothetical protein IDH44_01180 [Paenibacillus sp. IB182496]|uniref:Dihydrodiol dehydrogenase n=1 Tax=Paenibacillus sabuli TaxID=2772509 RepID=A0A927BQP1_9BACL|nr:hypothetical protein [Paenibacillus sabuli]MBD2843789.1 hypothetical protein [Paenibacillus sabuli]